MHFLQHIAIADICADDPTTEAGNEIIQAVVAHDGDGQAILFQGAFAQHGLRSDGHELIAIESDGFFITQRDAIGISIMGNASLSLALTNKALQFLTVRAATFFVDVETIRFAVKNLHIGTELLQSQRAGVR